MSRQLLNGLAGAWMPSFGPSGYTLLDRTACSLHATLQNMVSSSWLPNNGGMLTFNGTNQYVERTGWTKQQGVTQATLSGWIQRTATFAVSCLFGCGVAGTATNRFIVQPWSDSLIYFVVDGAWGTFSSNDTLLHHVCVVFNGGATGNANRLVVYIDGIQRTLTFTGTIGSAITNPTTVWIGRTFETTSDYGSGRVGDVLTWNRALTAGEAMTLYRIGPRGMANVMLQRNRKSYMVPVVTGVRRRRILMGME